MGLSEGGDDAAKWTAGGNDVSSNDLHGQFCAACEFVGESEEGFT